MRLLGIKHARVLQAIDSVAEVVLVNQSADRLRKLARNYRSAPCYTELGKALPHVDAVIVATPPTRTFR